jgi:putative flippase GtrA
MEAIRFLVVAVAGLILDIAIAWCAARLLGLPLWIAAATGFCVAALMNYALHELWTFRQGIRRISTGRALRYAAGLAITLAARVTAVAILAACVSNDRTLGILIVGAGVSFLVNFLISKHFVFRSKADSRDSP